MVETEALGAELKQIQEEVDKRHAEVNGSFFFTAFSQKEKGKKKKTSLTFCMSSDLEAAK